MQKRPTEGLVVFVMCSPLLKKEHHDDANTHYNSDPKEMHKEHNYGPGLSDAEARRLESGETI